MKKRHLVVGFSIVLAISLAVPALGAGGLGGVKSMAKKAIQAATGAQTAASNAQQAAGNAQDAAKTAQNTAAAALNRANSAEGAATSGRGVADTAQSAANAAQGTANSAQQGVGNAQDAAKTAQNSAAAALSRANAAEEAATTGGGVADTAQKAANAAQGTANTATKRPTKPAPPRLEVRPHRESRTSGLVLKSKQRQGSNRLLPRGYAGDLRRIPLHFRHGGGARRRADGQRLEGAGPVRRRPLRLRRIRDLHHAVRSG